MAFDSFLKVDGIPGESKDSNHKDWIEVLAFRHGAVQPVSTTASSAGGAATERAEFTPLTITKQVDKASPELWKACFTGRHIKEVVLQLYRSGGDKQQYLEIKMEKVLITSFDQAGGEAFPEEVITFAPGKIEMTYNQQSREDGSLQGSIAAGWDLTTNKAV